MFVFVLVISEPTLTCCLVAAGLFLDPRVPTASAFAAITSLVLRRIAVARPKDAFLADLGLC